MTPQEQQMIDGLIERIRNAQVPDKDLDTERYLQQNLATIPDALYILAQTVLVQQYGLQQAQQQIQQLQSALDEARQHPQQSGGGSFLSKIFGGPSGSQQQQPQYQPVNNPGYPPPYAPAYAPAYTQPVYPGSGGGFLRGALQTAAGVAMGEMAFESMESLFHGFGGGPYGYGHPNESVVNNYYDDAGQHEHHADDSNFYNPENDASRQDLGDQSSSQSSADVADNSGNDIGGFGNDSTDFVDNSGFDDSGFDDSGSDFDDGGGDNSI
ncbi:MAG TPA: DUF2076 domain-containing protein [Acidobacteriaceae bacterium]|nr:DUF2076 domain-containing protein [Acidobacteriaceae bacterium]